MYQGLPVSACGQADTGVFSIAESLLLQGLNDALQLPGGGMEGLFLLGAQGDFQHGLHPVLAHHGGDAEGQAPKAVGAPEDGGHRQNRLL